MCAKSKIFEKKTKIPYVCNFEIFDDDPQFDIEL